jgi:hypothetical protein
MREAIFAAQGMLAGGVSEVNNLTNSKNSEALFENEADLEGLSKEEIEALKVEKTARDKADADRAFSSAQAAQAAVDSKYQAEFTRLTTLKQQIQNQTSASGNVQSTGDSAPRTPSSESTALPDLEF